MNKSTINKVLLSRRLYQLSQDHLNSDNELSLSVGINLLQDSVEIFLLAVAEHIDADVGNNINFDKYFDQINNKIAPEKLPFRFRLNSLNKLRVNAKHYGLSPSKTEVTGLLETVKEFCEEVSIQILEKEFISISLIDLINNGEAKTFLQTAENNFIENDYKNCLINCRKALYVEFEKAYDISPYIDESKTSGLGLILRGYKSPFYAKNKKYIEENVKDTTDYIVYDSNELDMDLFRSGINPLDYWNVWRLTPHMYRKDRESEWVIKHEFNKFDEDGIKNRATYVLDSTINLILHKHEEVKRSKTATYRNFFVSLIRESVKIYEKADKASKVNNIVPIDCKQIYVDSKVSALHGEGSFWHVSHFENGLKLYGYMSDDDVES
jgi:hypothetical protein